MMTRQEKINALEMEMQFLNFGGFLFHFRDTGLTVAIIREFPYADYVQFGVSHCGDNDEFDELVGSGLAIERTGNGGSFRVAQGREAEFAEMLNDMQNELDY